MRSFPFTLAHIEVIVAGRTAPIHPPRGLPGQESAVLPKILARSGAAPAMQAMNHGCSDAARFQNETWQRFRQHARDAAGVLRCLNLLPRCPALDHYRVIQCAT
jgi:hypothetical protein